MNTIWTSLSSLLGLYAEPKDLTFSQITLRGIIVFGSALIMMRLSDRRSLTKKSPFDQMLLIILASILARAVNGSAAFFTTIGGAAVIVFLHRVLAFASGQWPAVATLIKGRPHLLVKEGRLQNRTMQLNHLTRADVEEDLRLTAKKEDLAIVKAARLEVSGDISFILKE